MGAKRTELIRVVEDIEHWRYDDGTVRNQYGHYIELPEFLEDTKITVENASEYGKRRKQKIMDAIEASVTNITSARGPADAIGMIVAKRASIALHDDTRVGNEAAKIVLQAMDAYQDRKQETIQTQRHEYTIDEETRDMLMRIAAHKRGDDVEDEEE